ncbi:cellulose synthase [Rhizobium ruizarguesonis]|uniref:cellulose synthesis protein n=1 Tax=Rhizobium ruizarguesonis TaxID=2081791 RepID=UPI0003639269|nr:cellulose synthesis protein [Rhizobium ruizarguesonis]MBY5831548.1 cellulose synthase [Rhizobium leguminosarum]QJS27049.1 cellulose synthase [Rhizobium leguminosarum bv. trifolii TA1]MBY5860241.1 cellulose synthase [Rhizobium leguminosarum]MBY5872807.1 cellulose synthase [Rhizobium leguminosarum]NEH63170.1 cellulose synthase [Rhizobium ruizarguesonis]
MKSSLVAISAAVVVATLVTGLKDRAALQERFGLGSAGKPAPELMMMGRIKPTDASAGNPEFNAQLVADKIEAITSPSPPAPGAREPDAAAPQPAAPQTVAQPAPVTPPIVSAPPAPQQAAAPAQPAVDESALRYFASRGDKVRLQAEISRLQALYPNWVPPADPLAVPQNGDKQLEAMWQLYSDGRYAELRKAVADRQAADAGWRPPADLLDRLDVAEARARLVNASDLKQYATVVDIAAATPSLLTCSEVDVLWRVAEAFIQTERAQRGQDAYTYILKNCANPAERQATVEKASTLLAYQPMQALLTLERPAADGSKEFDAIRDNLTRRFMAEGNDDPKLVIAPDYIARLEKLAETGGLASDALLLGWYQLRRNNDADAEKWFRAARAKQDSAAASQGLALALIARKAPEEAEDVMFRWRADSEDATSTYLAATANLMALQPPADLAEDVLHRIATEVIARKYVPTAQQFGWYARSLNQFQTAARWFETALAWKPDDEPSAYGLVITREQLSDRKAVLDLQRAWAGRSSRITNLEDTSSLIPNAVTPPPEKGTLAAQQPAAQPTQNPPTEPLPAERRITLQPGSQVVVRAARPAMETVTVPRGPRQTRGCSTTIDAGQLKPADALSRGWCLMDINRPMEAISAFEAALQSPTRKVREDAAYGQSLAYLRAGLSGNAAVAATKAPQNRQRAAELQVAILADRALSAFDAGRYRETLIYLDQRAQLQQERIDLMVLRGYCYLNLKMYGDATRIFEAAAATGSRDAARGLADVRNVTHPDVND